MLVDMFKQIEHGSIFSIRDLVGFIGRSDISAWIKPENFYGNGLFSQC